MSFAAIRGWCAAFVRLLLAVTTTLAASGCKGPPGERGPEGSQGAPGTAAPVVDLAARFATMNGAAFQVVCNKTLAVGTAFLHRSGRVITVAHVAGSCAKDDMLLVLPNGNAYGVKTIVTKPDVDLALIELTANIPGGLSLTQNAPPVGEALQWWGFPQGYVGHSPVAIRGYLAGEAPTSFGSNTSVYWIDGPMNHGESGGPVLEFETGSVIGVVVSNFMYRPPGEKVPQEALRNGVKTRVVVPHDHSGPTEAPEGQLIAEAFDAVNANWQSDIGIAVTRASLVEFLKANSIDP